MTTARSSWRSKRAAALTVILVLAGAVAISAHRRDEYLQAARIAIDPDRVEIALDLTPGISVAADVLARIDRDGDTFVSPGEARAYARELQRVVALDVDGAPLRVELIDDTFPPVEAVGNGEGTLRVNLAARVPPLAAGVHHLRYRNSHRSDIGVYLANALVPANDRVEVTAQRRDADQRELIIDYVLSPPRTHTRLQLSAGVALMSMLGVWRRRRHMESR